MTYCFFSAQYPPHVGGVENYTRRLAEKIVENGHNALVVTSARDGLPAEEVSPAGVEVLRLPSWLLAGGRLPVVRKNRETKKALEKLRARGVDRIIVQTRLYLLSLLGVNFARENSIPLVVIEHGSEYTKSGFAPADLVLKAYVGGLLRRFKKLGCPFYAVSASAADWLFDRGIPAEGLLYNAVALEAVRAAKESPHPNWRARFNIPNDALVVAYAGRLVPEKGVLQLARAVRQYNGANPTGAWLLAAGQGPLLPALQTDEDPHIRALGPLAFGEVVGLLRQADLFCLPTALREGLPSSLLEAGACGCPVVATALGGVREVVPDETYGYLVEDNAPGTLCRVLERAAADPQDRQEKAMALQKRVIDMFSYDALYERLDKIDWRTLA